MQALGGAKNHMVVLPDADLDLAADAAVNAGFGSAGERCMAISVLVAVDPIGDELVGKISERIAALTVGPGSAEGSDMGPLVTGSTATRSRAIWTAASPTAPRWPSTAVTTRAAAAADGFWLGPDRA